MNSAPIRRRFLRDLLIIRRTGRHPDGRSVGPILKGRLDTTIESLAASLRLNMVDGGSA